MTLLLAISLWSLVNSVLGDKVDVSSITIKELAIIAEREICEDDEDPAAKLPKLNSIKQYAKWKKEMLAYTDTKRSKAGLRLSYVVRGRPPLIYTGLKDKLHHLIPISVSSATYVRGRKIIFTYLDESIEDPIARSWLETDNHRKDYNGRNIWIHVQRICKGDSVRSKTFWSVLSTWAMGSATQRRQHLG